MNSRCPSCARKNGVSPHLEDSFFIKSQMQSLYWIPTDNFEVSIDSLWINSLILTVFSFPIAYFVKFSNRIVFTEAICTLLWWPTPGVKKKIKIQLFPRLTWQPLIRILIKCQTLDRQCRFPSSVEIYWEGWLSFVVHIKLNLCYELADDSMQPKSLIAALYSWRKCTCQTCTKKWRRNTSLREYTNFTMVKWNKLD